MTEPSQSYLAQRDALRKREEESARRAAVDALAAERVRRREADLEAAREAGKNDPYSPHWKATSTF